MACFVGIEAINRELKAKLDPEHWSSFYLIRAAVNTNRNVFYACVSPGTRRYAVERSVGTAISRALDLKLKQTVSSQCAPEHRKEVYAALYREKTGATLNAQSIACICRAVNVHVIPILVDKDETDVFNLVSNNADFKKWYESHTSTFVEEEDAKATFDDFDAPDEADDIDISDVYSHTAPSSNEELDFIVDYLSGINASVADNAIDTRISIISAYVNSLISAKRRAGQSESSLSTLVKGLYCTTVIADYFKHSINEDELKAKLSRI